MRTGASIADSWSFSAGRDFVAADALSRCRIPAPLACVVLASLLASFAMSGAGVAQTPIPARVLVVHSNTSQVPASVILAEAAKKRMTERRAEIEFYTEFLDFERFASDGHGYRMARLLGEKYQNQKPDVILANGPTALRFLVQNRKNLGFEAPIVFSLTSRERLAGINPDDGITGIVSEFDLAKTVSVAERLQPDARSIVVVSGASEFDRQWALIARRQLAPYSQKFEMTFLEGMPHDELLSTLRSLTRNTIVVMLTINRTGDGRVVVPAEIVKDVADASGAPVYSPYQSHLGSGVVGGHTDSFEGIGLEVADLALSILAGTAPSALSPRPTASDRVRVDWRQLRRWGMSENSLPAATEILFREPGPWERYHWQIIAIMFVLIVQAAALAAMMVERHRRQAAQATVRQRLLEVMHLNRSAMAGALSASVAHELNQPLAAIQSYADTAEIYLKASPLNVDRLEAMLSNIRADNQRAADIISHFRGLLKRKEAFELQELDLNDVVRNAVRIIDSEALKRGVSLRANPAGTSLPVRADEVHLQQVILNLAVNGMDAMQDTAANEMSIQTALVGDSQVEVSVADTGAGIPADKLNTIFDTFYTTKRHGTGLGLSIARTIVETYGGRIWAENRPDGGAAFRFTLPLSKGTPA